MISKFGFFWYVFSTRRYHMLHSLCNNGLIEMRVRWTFYCTFDTPQLAALAVIFNASRLFFCGATLKLTSIHTISLQLSNWKTTLKNLLVKYRWKEYAKIELSGFEAQSRSTFAWNNLQTLNCMDRSVDSYKGFMHFSEFYVFFFEKFSYIY